MIFSHETTRPPASDERQRGAPSASALRELVCRLDPELDRTSPTADAALLLLAARSLEHNVVKLARFLGLEQAFVARCARRLVDNGVWREGDTACHWDATPFDDPRFWADVAVAEGKLCRRIDDQGQMQWAPGGHWWKSFDLVTSSPPGQSVLYHSPPPSAPFPEPLPLDEGEEAAEESAVDAVWNDDAAAVQGWKPSPVRPAEVETEEPCERGDESGDSSDGESPRQESVKPQSSPQDLFPDAAWL